MPITSRMIDRSRGPNTIIPSTSRIAHPLRRGPVATVSQTRRRAKARGMMRRASVPAADRRATAIASPTNRGGNGRATTMTHAIATASRRDVRATARPMTASAKSGGRETSGAKIDGIKSNRTKSDGAKTDGVRHSAMMISSAITIAMRPGAAASASRMINSACTSSATIENDDRLMPIGAPSAATITAAIHRRSRLRAVPIAPRADKAVITAMKRSARTVNAWSDSALRKPPGARQQNEAAMTRSTKR